MIYHCHLILSFHLINEMTTQLVQQMKNKMQVKVEINLVSHINLKCKFRLSFHSENEV